MTPALLSVEDVALRVGRTARRVRAVVAADPARYGAIKVPVRKPWGFTGGRPAWRVPAAAVGLVRASMAPARHVAGRETKRPGRGG